MKIGIITFHRAHNYGAVLQCYALQEYLKGLGYDAYVIDYRQKYIEYIYKKINIKYLIRCILNFKIKFAFFYLKNHLYDKKRRVIFNRFNEKFLNTTYPITSTTKMPNFDIYIIGSDQVWSLQCTNGFDPIYWGDFKKPENSKIIGYAISTNNKSISEIGENKMFKLCQNFNNLSIREESFAKIISKISKRNINTCIDPTLLPNIDVWNKLINDKWKYLNYIFIYQARFPNYDVNYLKRKAKKIAREFHWEIIDMSLMTFSPEDFISAIKYAKCIITTSFHAAVFSIIYEKPLCCIKLNDGHDNRYVDLLKSIKADDLIFNKDSEITIKEVNYKMIKQNLNNIRHTSIEFLNSINRI